MKKRFTCATRTASITSRTHICDQLPKSPSFSANHRQRDHPGDHSLTPWGFCPLTAGIHPALKKDVVFLSTLRNLSTTFYRVHIALNEVVPTSLWQRGELCKNIKVIDTVNTSCTPEEGTPKAQIGQAGWLPSSSYSTSWVSSCRQCLIIGLARDTLQQVRT
jgi:hypothetical protein